MFHRIAVSMFATALLAPAAWAQTPLRARPPETFKYLSAKEVVAMTDKPGPGVKTGFPVDHEDYDVEYAQRTDKGNEPEVHTYRTHYIHVISGESSLTYGGTVTHSTRDGKDVLTLSDDFKVPDTPDPHWQVVDSKGNTYLLQRLGAKSLGGLAKDRINMSITLPPYVRDVAKVQIYCAWAEAVLGETAFDAPLMVMNR